MTQSINLKNASTQASASATIKVPLDASYIGKNIEVSYSED